MREEIFAELRDLKRELSTEKPAAENSSTGGVIKMQETQGFDPMIEARYKMLMEQQTKRVEQEINLLKQGMQQLSNEVTGLRFELKRLNEAPSAPQAQKPKVVEKQESLKTQPASQHPRQGGYTPEDVPIDKIFYFGHK